MNERPIIAHFVYNLMRGGTEGQCAQTALWLQQAGWPQRLLVFQREGYYLEPVERALGPVHEVPIRRLLRWETWKMVWGLAQWLREEKVRMLHTWDADAAIFGYWAARLARIPLITSRRDLGEIYPMWKLSRMAKADRKARRVVINAECIRTSILVAHRHPEKVEWVPNLFDCATFDAEASHPALGKPLDEQWVGLVARLDPEKDVSTFLRAAVQVAAHMPRARFLVAGQGKQKKTLEQMAAQMGLRGRVVFLGEVQHIPALLTTLNVGVLLSRTNEGLSNTILEYMAAGLPVVATDCGGNRELVTNGRTGFIVPVEDDPMASRAIIHLLQHPDRALEMGAAGRRRVEQDFAPEKIADRFASIYQAVAAGR